MRLSVRVIRRFVDRGPDPNALTEVARAVELGIPPQHGMLLAFGDGSPDVTISKIRHLVATGTPFGVRPVELEAICCREPAAGLEAALAAGWQRVAPAPDPEGTP